MESVFGSASILQCYCRREERITRGIPQEETLGAMIAAILRPRAQRQNGVIQD